MESNGLLGTTPPPAVEQGYRAVRLLGTGRTARVWLAVRESDGARFALKLPLALSGGPGSTFETRRELNILSRFEHENLLHLHTVLETDQGPGLLMEWAPGQSLARLSEVRGLLPPGQAVTVLVGIASCLAYLHALKVSHGDVSAGNILFTANGKPLLAGLGTAQLSGTGAGAGALPEADVFALATVGWLVLTGRQLPPAERRLPLGALVPDLPPALAAAIDAGLYELPEQRPDAAEFARLVFTAAAAQPLDLALAVEPGAGAEPQTRRARREQEDTGASRRWRGLRHRTWHRSFPGYGATREYSALQEYSSPPEYSAGERRGPRRLLLGAAAVLVAAVMGVGAVAVAAPEILQFQEPGPAAGAERAGPGGKGTSLGPEEPAGEKQDGRGSPPVSPLPGTDEPAGEPAGAAGTDPPVPEPARESPLEPPPPMSPPEPAPEFSEQISLALLSEAELQQLVRSEDAVQAVRALAEWRVRAFSAADADLLGKINVPGSPAMETDQAEIAKLEAAGTGLTGLIVEVLPAGPAVPGPDGRARVRAAVSTSAYAEQDPHGHTVRNAGAVSGQDLVLVMVRTAGGWRIEDILAPP